MWQLSHQPWYLISIAGKFSRRGDKQFKVHKSNDSFRDQDVWDDLFTFVFRQYYAFKQTNSSSSLQWKHWKVKWSFSKVDFRKRVFIRFSKRAKIPEDGKTFSARNMSRVTKKTSGQDKKCLSIQIFHCLKQKISTRNFFQSKSLII